MDNSRSLIQNLPNFAAFVTMGVAAGLWGCHMFGNPDKDSCSGFKPWGIWLTFIFSVITVLSIAMRGSYKMGSGGFGF